MSAFKKSAIALLFTSPLLLTACGGSSDSDNDSMVAFNLAVSDAPVDHAVSVVACFNEVELKGGDNSQIFIVGGDNGEVAANDVCKDETGNVVPNTHGIDLMQFTGDDAAVLIEGTMIPVGQYTQMRLSITPESYAEVKVMDEETGEYTEQTKMVSVSVPSNELKLDGFVATQGNEVSLTVEFDLRKSMVNPQNSEDLVLKPRGVRLVDNNTAGHIEGDVNELRIQGESCDNNGAFVYLYEGTIAVADMGDLHYDANSNYAGVKTEPLASVAVVMEEQGGYEYEIGYVQAGQYTLALTCSADNSEQSDELTFIMAKTADVADKQTSEVNFN
ncbi:DUF4382 domain-containing protein [Thalassotalea sp. HSM 43]|uniref:DUF4382 domain-containing protein n=1 Tax=Thalassotalea sp. HSM 43 TaxID=2552945 RepID=UPI0010810CAF|nr:DUF4382 domain-containing protein [Thalassotalea sp. HSM 43]QBY05902.1 DUF4382 domain-containing protein [Thalassotalea sp. HSM 43]